MTKEELTALKLKAKEYGHYAKFLRVEDLISEIERLELEVETAWDAFREKEFNSQ